MEDCRTRVCGRIGRAVFFGLFLCRFFAPDVETLFLCHLLGMSEFLVIGIASSILCVIGGESLFHKVQVEVAVVNNHIGKESFVTAPAFALKFKVHAFACEPLFCVQGGGGSQGGVLRAGRMNRFRCVDAEQSYPLFAAMKVNVDGVAVHDPEYFVEFSIPCTCIQQDDQDKEDGSEDNAQFQFQL